MNKNINLQDVFLNQARKERIGVTIFLTIPIHPISILEVGEE